MKIRQSAIEIEKKNSYYHRSKRTSRKIKVQLVDRIRKLHSPTDRRRNTPAKSLIIKRKIKNHT